MRKILFITTLLLLVGLTACGGGAPKVDWELRISGAVGRPLALSYGELAQMPQTGLKDLLMEKSLGEDVIGSWSGVSLAEIFQEAEVGGDYVSVTATAADGYAVEITKDELQDAIVALKENDEWIAAADEDHGPIRLVCPHTPANRWVFQLQEIQVNE
jgi:DMSO/TMAO reductase YedYZ molybdopterin-dependent catalytic subunit